MFTDKKIVCKKCKAEFDFYATEQEFYANKGFIEPLHCPECRATRKAMAEKREMFSAFCSSCGRETLVPFQPLDDRKIFCRNCLHTIRPANWWPSVTDAV